MTVEEVRPREADDQDRRLSAPADHVLDQVEEGALGPLKVVQADDQGLLASKVLEQPAHGPHRLLGRSGAFSDPDCGGHLTSDPRRVWITLEQSFDSARRHLSCRIADDVAQRPVGDAFSVRQTAPDENSRLFADFGQVLLDQPRLADARRTEDGDEPARLVAHGLLEGVAQLRELRLAAHHRCVEPAGEAGRARDDAQQAPGLDRR